jgi:CRP/FNR family transcriptional regulator, cyclic AMP receptor protein
MVRVLELDPDLGRHLSTEARLTATASAVAPLITLGVGPTSFLIEDSARHSHLGLLVLDGLVGVHLNFGQIGTTDFLGPGDLLRPWVDRGAAAELAQVSIEILAPAQLAALDHDFARRIRPWPELAAALLDRAAQRSDAQSLRAALYQAKRVEDRVLLALWHFAGRWGHVAPEGRVVNLQKISGELLARFVGARRQSVSTALSRLVACGAITRRADGTFVLARQPPELDEVLRGRRATDVEPGGLRSAVR